MKVYVLMKAVFRVRRSPVPTYTATTLALRHMLHNGNWENKEAASRGVTRRTRCRQTGATAVNQAMSHKLQQVPNIKTQKALGRGAPVFIVIRVTSRHSTCGDVVDSEYDLILTGACGVHAKVVVNVVSSRLNCILWSGTYRKGVPTHCSLWLQTLEQRLCKDSLAVVQRRRPRSRPSPSVR